VVIVLVGLIASGKSTFAEALQKHVSQIRRCNQDELGNRRRVEEASRSCLRQGLSVCIDRTNLDSTQRSHWIGIAREFPGTPVWVIVFDTPYDVCMTRLWNRRNHPTITDANDGMRVLSRFASTMELPQPGEGYDKLISLAMDQQPPAGYTREDVLAILQRLRESPSVRINVHDIQGTTQPSRNQEVDGNSRYSREGSRSRSHGRRRRAFPLGNTTERRNGHGFD